MNCPVVIAHNLKIIDIIQTGEKMYHGTLILKITIIAEDWIKCRIRNKGQRYFYVKKLKRMFTLKSANAQTHKFRYPADFL